MAAVFPTLRIALTWMNPNAADPATNWIGPGAARARALFRPCRFRLIPWGAVFLIAAGGAVGARAAQGASAKTDPVAATSSAEASKAPAPNSNAACLECHSDQQLTMKKAGHVVPLFFDQGRFTRSVHKNLDCTDCH